MRLTPVVRGLTLAAALLPPAAAALLAQSDTWALTNARIQTVTKGVIDKGTILIRKGLIETVGPAVTIPADARVIDLSGKTVSPGLIDLTSSLGLAAPAAGGGGQGGGAQAAPSGPRGLEPDRDVARELKVAPADVKPLRDAGIAAVLVAPSRGLFRGMSALIPLRDSVDDSEVIRSQVAMHIGYQSVPGDYPGTLLGVIAYQRQAFYDAQRQGLILDRYRTNPRGMERPENDPGLEALVPVVRVVLRGATEAWMLADTLAARKIPIIVGPLTATPDGDAPYDAIYAYPGVLAKAGVQIAFQTNDGGEGDARNLPYNAALATAYGLDPEEALRAVTINPARIWGVADRIGSIEAGKVANLFLTTGDPLDVRSQVREVFIRGQRMPWDDRHTTEYQKFRNRPKP